MVNFIDEHQVLLETLLVNDWTWGCELEGYYRDMVPGSRSRWDDDDDDYDDDDDDENIDYDYLYDEILRKLLRTLKNNCKEEFYNSSGSEVHSDGSLSNQDDSLAFEWATPIFKATPQAFEGFINTLNDLVINGDVYTDDDCGFHHHLMFNGMNERDCIWIYCNLAMDSDFIEFTKKFEDFTLFHNRWSSDSAFVQIKDYIEEGNWSKVLEELSTEKYRLFRIHPQGTLEWRGPRDFLNRPVLNVIKNFYLKHLPKIILKFNEYNRSKTLFNTNITKEEFFDNLTQARKANPNQKQFGDNEFIINRGASYRNKNKNPNLPKKPNMKRIWEQLEEKPLVFSYLLKNDVPILNNIFSNINWDTVNILKNILNKIKEKNGYLMNTKDFTDKFIDYWEKNAQGGISNMMYYGIFDYLDINCLDKNLLREDFLQTRQFAILKLYTKKASVGEVEHLIYDSNYDIMYNKYFFEEYPKYIIEKFGPEMALKFCYFLIKLMYQKNITTGFGSLSSPLDYIRDIVMEYGDQEFLTKWNNMAIDLTINKNVCFARIIINLTPEEYIRIRSEVTGFDYEVPKDIRNNLPFNVKELIKKM